VDNLFIFLVIMSAFSVRPIDQHKALLVGILLALILRGVFIAIGAAVIAQFSWVFYAFGLFLVFTAYKLSRSGIGGEDEEYHETRLTRLTRRVIPITDRYHGSKVFVKIKTKRYATPLFIVMVAIGSTDVIFAVDSIPAIFGLTKEPFLVFTANAFALMGLRQLYFLLGGLLKQLSYLSVGLAVILGFIGVKMVLEALHTNTIPFINGGSPVPVWTINIGLSLTVIVGILAITAVASVIKSRLDQATAARCPEPANNQG
jgi:tellurite resistance protein TerC